MGPTCAHIGFRGGGGVNGRGGCLEKAKEGSNQDKDLHQDSTAEKIAEQKPGVFTLEEIIV